MKRCAARRLVCLAAMGIATGCERAPAPAAVPGDAQPTEASPESSRAARTQPPNRTPAASAEAPATKPPGKPAPPSRGATFPPLPVVMPHERTAQPGDGEWKPETAGGSVDGAAVSFSATIRPHAIKKWIYVQVVAIDLTRTRLHLVAGTDEPESKHVPKEARPAIVATSDLPHLVSVFNGGFQARHGGYGMKLGPHTFLEPRKDACVILIDEAGQGVRIGPWSELAEQARDVLAYRQTPECLISGGKLHRDLESERRSRRWGRSIEKKVEVRRTALGVDATGEILFFGLGEWTSPKDIALAMQLVGAEDAAQLDINWSYTRYLYFDRDDQGKYRVSGTLIPDLKHHSRGYVERPSYRDFFYVTRHETTNDTPSDGTPKP